MSPRRREERDREQDKSPQHEREAETTRPDIFTEEEDVQQECRG